MTRDRTVAVVIAALASVTLAASCSSSSRAAPAATAPTTGARTAPTTTEAVAPSVGANWQTTTPARVGLDAAALAQISTTARTGNSHCLDVVRDDKIAFEAGYGGRTADSVQDIFSATKSIASVLVGIAQDDGDLKITDSASKYVPGWKGTPAQAVTIKDLLSMDSGRAWSPVIDYVQLLGSADQTAFALGLTQTTAPGTVWAYNNSAVQTLQAVLHKATGEDVATYAKQRLFDPLGMTQTKLGHDRAGNAQMFEGATSTCRDLARFGQLLLNDGKWGTKQIVSAAYLHSATAVSSTHLNDGYGYLFWLNHYGVIDDPLVATSLRDAASPTRTRGRIASDAPNSMYWVLGLGNQIVQVDPGSGIVVVRLGTAQARPKPPTFGPEEASNVVTKAILPGRSKG
jgi:CubicO group peptidase (beta-lactamase class C family)